MPYTASRAVLDRSFTDEQLGSAAETLLGHAGQQQQPPGVSESQASHARQVPLGDSLVEEDDYVIVDPAPSSQASSQASRSRSA